MHRYRTLLFVILCACGSSDPAGLGDGNPNGGAGGDAGAGGDGAPVGGDFGDGGSRGDSSTTPPVCNHVLQATIRDFKPCRDPAIGEAGDCTIANAHVDFEHFMGPKQTKGIVQQFLGAADAAGLRKPLYAGTGAHYYYDDPSHPTNGQQQTTGPNEFAQWYQDVTNVNLKFTTDIPLTETPLGSGKYRFDSRAFFPIDGKGWQNHPTLSDGTTPHNFGFTTEMHLNFVYKGGEVFSFTGDDDLWVFIDHELALDIGGVHPSVSDSVKLDDFAAKHPLTKGATYAMDLFHAERHTTESNFTVDTTIECLETSPIH